MGEVNAKRRFGHFDRPVENRMERRSYLIRYGSMGVVGRFLAEDGSVFERGRPVVIRSRRGTELGEVLIESPRPTTDEAGTTDHTGRILQAAAPEDLERGRDVARDRQRRFEACDRLFQDGLWPIELLDAEPLLDKGRTVLHYLGPHRLDVEGLMIALEEATGLDLILEPVGRDVELEDEASADSDGGCGDCGSKEGGCGSGGCGSDEHGCSDCGVKKLLARRR